MAKILNFDITDCGFNNINVSMIVARDYHTKVIGRQNDIPWKCPSDMKRFKQMTTGNIVIMGRKTWESIGSKPLPNRLNIIITSDIGKLNLDERVNDILIKNGAGCCALAFNSIEEALIAINENTSIRNVWGEEVFIIGGKKLYDEGLQYCSTVHLTELSNTGISKLDTDTIFDTFIIEQSKDGINKFRVRINDFFPWNHEWLVASIEHTAVLDKVEPSQTNITLKRIGKPNSYYQYIGK